MAFGQPSGPPATARQLRDLLALIEGAGHSDFRDARGPLGLNQRQAGGRFTQDEATALIARLEAEAEAEAEHSVDGQSGSGHSSRSGVPGSPPANRTPRPPRAPSNTPAAKTSTLADQLQRVPEELLVDELRRRGWALIPPSLAH